MVLIMSFIGHNLSCDRGGRHVFDQVNFNVPEGAALIISGPNGSGKTSLLRLAAGLVRPVTGRLTWEGMCVFEDPGLHASRLHFVGHLDAIKPALTVEANLQFWVRLQGRGRPHIVEEALERLGLSMVAKVPANTLSAGQRRRLSLARLATNRLPLWCLDEPSVGLDHDANSILNDLINEHQAGNGRVLLATHHNFELTNSVELRLVGEP